MDCDAREAEGPRLRHRAARTRRLRMPFAPASWCGMEHRFQANRANDDPVTALTPLLNRRPLDRHTMKRLLTFAVVLGCASATVGAQTATKPAIYAAPTDDGVLVGGATAALWSMGWSATQAPVPAPSCVILERASAGAHATQ